MTIRLPVLLAGHELVEALNRTETALLLQGILLDKNGVWSLWSWCLRTYLRVLGSYLFVFNCCWDKQIHRCVCTYYDHISYIDSVRDRGQTLRLFNILTSNRWSIGSRTVAGTDFERSTCRNWRDLLHWFFALRFIWFPLSAPRLCTLFIGCWNFDVGVIALNAYSCDG